MHNDISLRFKNKTNANAKERLSTAHELCTGTHEDITFAATLHDADIDGYPPEWLYVIALAALDPHSPAYDLRKAGDLSLYGLLLENQKHFSAETVSMLYQNFMTPTKDLDAALFWLDLAFKNEKRAHIAARKIADIFIREDARFDNDHSKTLYNYVIDKLDFSISQNNQSAMLLKGRLLLLGTGGIKKEQEGLYLIKQSIKHAKENIPSKQKQYDETIHQATNLLLMHKLTDPKNQNRNEYFELKDVRALFTRYKPYLSEQSQSFWARFFILSEEKNLSHLITLCHGFSTNSVSEKEITSSLSSLLESENHRDLYHILFTFSDLQNQKSRHSKWLKLLHRIENTEHDISKYALRKATQDTGPRYNPISDEGLPILGVWERASHTTINPTESKTAYVPPAGIQSLDAIRTDNQGTIHFETTQDEHLPAKLLPEDFKVIMALIFGDPEKPHFPIFDLPFADLYPSRAENRLHIKRFDPAWLCHTALGKSLYAADVLIGQLAFMPLKMPVGTTNQTITKETPDLAKTFLTQLHYTSGIASGANGRRVMLIPENTKCEISRQKENKGKTCFRIENIQTRIRVDGEENELNKDKPNSSLNDTFFHFPRVTQKLTDRFQAASLYLPLLKRTEELLKLINSLRALRQAGYKPSEQIQKECKETLHYYRELPLPDQKTLLCRPEHDIF